MLSFEDDCADDDLDMNAEERRRAFEAELQEECQSCPECNSDAIVALTDDTVWCEDCDHKFRLVDGDLVDVLTLDGDVGEVEF
jgi:Zn finger protein HypA/HybF involved in hydrogenase expression